MVKMTPNVVQIADRPRDAEGNSVNTVIARLNATRLQKIVPITIRRFAFLRN